MQPFHKFQRQGSQTAIIALLIFGALLTAIVLVSEQFVSGNIGNELTAQLFPSSDPSSSSSSSSSPVPDGCTLAMCDACASGGNVCTIVSGNCQCIGGDDPCPPDFCTSCTDGGGECVEGPDDSCACAPPSVCYTNQNADGSCPLGWTITEGSCYAPEGTTCLDCSNGSGICGAGACICNAVCGNGITETGEQCEQDFECPQGQSCSNCQCSGGNQCGNGQIDSGETCGSCPVDVICQNGTQCCADGSCQVSCGGGGQCGDGTVDAGEECDDGNTVNGDGCSDSCTNEEVFCGNGQIDPDETCGSCPADVICQSGTQCCADGSCQVSCGGGGQCGDGTVDAGEECDDGNTVSGDGCSDTCTDETAFCDNGQIDAGETCLSCPQDVTCQNGTQCCADGSCQVSCGGGGQCGDGTVDIGEECDLGDGNGIIIFGDCIDYDCYDDCSLPICGDGIWNAGCVNGRRSEECDDGNTLNGDGCTPACEIEDVCGNGIIEEASEQCEHDFDCPQGQSCSLCQCSGGNRCTVSSDCQGQNTCCVSQQCVQAECGDGRVQCGEECEPGFIEKLCVRGDGVVLMGCGDPSHEGDSCGNGPCLDPDSDGNGNCQGAGATACRTDDDCMGACEFRTSDPCCTTNCTSTESPLCTIGCGNGNLETGEECDDGNTQSGDGCSSTCNIEGSSCGNGQIDPGEQCESTSDCSIGESCVGCSCTHGTSVCGNDRIDPGEECEENSDCTNNEFCGNSCQCDPVPASCGNAIIDAPNEQCDDGGICNGGTANGSMVTSVQEAVECARRGGSVIPQDSDGCTAQCILEHLCGNGILEFTESCDDGGTCTAGNIGQKCTLLTVQEDCGVIGICEPQDGDGCNASCGIEECSVLGNPGSMNAYTWSLYDLGVHQNGMYNATSYSPPADPRGLEWFSDEYKTFFGLYGAQGTGNDIREVPFIGPVENVPLDPSYFASKWEGVLHVPERGNYTYHFGARDDIWVIIDGVVHGRDTGLKSTITTNRRSIILEPGDHTVEVYYASRTPVDCRMLSEIACKDGRDDDRDTMIDCADPDCSFALACGGTGCKASEQCDVAGSVSCPNGSVKENKGTICANGGQCTLCKEIACNDTLDNDGDLRIDEADNDCQNLQSILPSSIERRSLLNLFVGKAHAEEIDGVEKAERVEKGKTPEASMGSVSSSASSDSFFSKIFQTMQAFFSALLPDGSSLLGQVTGTPECSDGLDNNNDGTIDFATYVNTIYLPQWERIVDILVDAEHERTYVLGTRPDEPSPTSNTFYNPILWEIDSRTFTILREVALPTGIIIQANSLIDTTRRVAYFGIVDTTNVKILRVDLDAMQLFPQSTLTLPAGSGPLGPAVIDTANNFAYYARRTGLDIGSKIMKINLNTFQWTAEISTEAIVERHLVDAVIDPVAGFAYFGASPALDPRVSAARIIKVQLNPFQKVQSVSLNPNTDIGISAMAIDPGNNTIYVATRLKNGVDLFLRKIRISPFELTAGTVQLLETDNDALDRAMVMDTQRQMMYVGLKNANPSVAKINVNAELQDVIYRTQSNTVKPYLDSAVIDTAFHRVLFPVQDGSISNRIPDGVMIISTADPDPGCSSANDQVEGTQCNDTRDNDGDGLVDRDDPGCYTFNNRVTGTYNPSDETEANSVQCGNGGMEVGEQCDDGNTTDGDGCSSTCQWELYPECLDLYRSTQRGLQDGISITTNGSNALMIRGENLTWNAIDTNGNITILDSATIDSAQYGRMSALDDRHFVITYRKNTAVFPFLINSATARAVHIVDNAIIMGDEVFIGPNFGPNGYADGTWFSIDRLTDTKFVVAFRYQSGTEARGYVRMGEVTNNTTINWTTFYLQIPSGVLNIEPGKNVLDVAGIDENSFMIAYAHENAGQFTSEVAIGTPSGSSISLSGEQPLAVGNSAVTEIAIDKLSDSRFAIIFKEDCLEGKTAIMTGNTIDSFGDAWQLCDGDRGNISISGIDENTYMVVDRGNVTGTIEARIFEEGFSSMPSPIFTSNSEFNDPTAIDVAGRALIIYGGTVDASYCSACQNLRDDDGDSLVDFGTDPGCSSPTDNNELGDCYDGTDNDTDTYTDCADPACHPGGIVINPNSCTPPEATLESANTPRCGDGATDANEQCDDGNLVAGDGCSIICTNEGCGNGQIDPPEQCDDGNSSNVDACPDGTEGSCRSATCGDGFVWTTGNPNPAGPEICDDKTENGQPNRCNSSCTGATSPICGNGFIEQGEQCDDANTQSGDGCATNCQKETFAMCKEVFGTSVPMGTSPSTGFSAVPSSMDTLPDGKFVVASAATGDARVGRAATDGSITWLTPIASFEPIGSATIVPNNADVAWIDSNRFVVTYQRGTRGIAVIGEHTGTAIQWKTPVNISPTPGSTDGYSLTHVAVSKLRIADSREQGAFVVAFREVISHDLKVNIGRVDSLGGIIMGTPTTITNLPNLISSHNHQIAITAVDWGRFVVAFTRKPFGDYIGQAQAFWAGAGGIQPIGNSAGVFFQNASAPPSRLELDLLSGTTFYVTQYFPSIQFAVGTISPTSGISFAQQVPAPDALAGIKDSTKLIQQILGRFLVAENTTVKASYCTQCQDGVDNADTEDTLIDAADLGCTDIYDNDERNACADATDNDGDGLIDINDPGCYTNGNATIASDYSGVDMNESHTPRCGNGVRETINNVLEQCDDGNLAGGDGCSALCKREECGNMIVDPGEQCDDQNQNNNDGCLTTCQNATCGDSFVRTGVEQCDNGASNSNTTPNACRLDCMNPRCGDSVIDSGETCDEGPQNGLANRCNATCSGITNPVCGNAAVEQGEQCDDGDGNNTDLCPDGTNGTCSPAICGDGHLWNTEGGTEQCDDGNTSTTDACPSGEIGNPDTLCKPARCGDGFIWNGVEICDDGDGLNSDSCPDGTGGSCRAASCGDGFLWNTDGGTEECDDGDGNRNDSCPDGADLSCAIAHCGDGFLWNTDGGTEECDDANAINGDGCSNTCTFENALLCTDLIGPAIDFGQNVRIASIDTFPDQRRFAAASDNGSVRIGTIHAGGSISWGPIHSLGNPNAGIWIVYTALTVLDDTHIAVIKERSASAQTNGNVEIIIGNVNGTTIQWGTPVIVEHAGNLKSKPSIIALSPTKIVTMYRISDGCSSWFCTTVLRLGTVNGNALTMNDAVTGFISSAADIAAITPDSLLLASGQSPSPRHSGHITTFTITNDTLNLKTGQLVPFFAKDQPSVINRVAIDASSATSFAIAYSGQDNCYASVAGTIALDGTIATTDGENGCSTGLINIDVMSVDSETHVVATHQANTSNGSYLHIVRNNQSTQSIVLNSTHSANSPINIASIDNGIVATYPTSTLPSTSAKVLYCAACQNRKDDDGDGTVDFGGDLGCSAILDDDERNICSDTLDNDSDTFIDNRTDIEDPGCYAPENIVSGVYTPQDMNEAHTITCGNGRREGPEQCDDGDGIRNDSCVDTGGSCSFARCGDGAIWNTDGGVEQCDDGNNNRNDSCPDGTTGTCQTARCGDGFTFTIANGGNEFCDDADTDNTDACTNNCFRAACGDGYLQPRGADDLQGTADDETCDDGAENGQPNKCASNCKGMTLLFCSNGIVELTGHPGQTEQCDDGNKNDNDSCPDNVPIGATQGWTYGRCQNARCGDGFLWNTDGGTEQCDDMNTNNTDACAECRFAVCGDGYHQPKGADDATGTSDDEQCDDGTSNSTNPNSCRPGCVLPICGDRVLDTGFGETCDDPNGQNGQPLKCNTTCNGITAAICGNAVIETGETCDDGGQNGNPNRCNNSCNGVTPANCGNAVIEQGEQCDDGRLCQNGVQNGQSCDTQPQQEACFLDGGSCNANAVPDACRSDCQLPRCGDNTKDAREVCDDGVQNGQPNTCNSTCTGITSSICGNLIIEAGETCDDGAENGRPNKCNTSCDGTTSANCGNKVIEQGEQCDNGNTCTGGTHNGQSCLSTTQQESCFAGGGICNADTVADACRTGCVLKRCGDNVRDSSEQCDNGSQNGQPNQCNLTCTGTTASVCGNTVVEAGETCDDGSQNGQYLKCNTTCNGTTSATCGNGIIEGNEQCDDGSNNSDTVIDACRATGCRRAYCGDTVKDTNEQCDDGIQNGLPLMCSTSCNGTSPPLCGNNVIEAGETCDDGNRNGQPLRCNTACSGITDAACGNGAVEQGEQCDDGNLKNNDLCPDGGGGSCEPAFCGDGHTWNTAGGTEECDDGNSNSNSQPNACRTTCKRASCGDNVQDAGESCDDGNSNTNDACPDGTGGICIAARCGDGFLWNTNGGTEICDEGMQNGSPNHCNIFCTGLTSSVCGNAITEAGETCDDGDHSNTDRCPDGTNGTCLNARCGDGHLYNTDGGTEVCDDGAQNGEPNQCNPTCTGMTPPECGNGVIEQGENCDDGNQNNNDSCPDGVGGTCQLALCGDAFLWNTDGGTEACDDGAQNGTPLQCNSSCSDITEAICGNGIAEAGEDCDDANQNNNDACPDVLGSGSCKTATCGDAYIWNEGGGTEFCDDGTDNGEPLKCNTVCSDTTLAVCGNGIPERGEECDDANTQNLDGCSASCKDENICTLDDMSSAIIFYFDPWPGLTITPRDACMPACGDGTIDPGEECDDGNVADDDGCNAVCKLEYCGDADVQPPREQCDPGYSCASGASCTPDGTPCSDGSTCALRCIASDVCSNTCQIPTCGNGTIECGEQCDPGLHGECRHDPTILCDLQDNDSNDLNPTCLNTSARCQTSSGFCDDGSGTICDDDFDCEVPNICDPVPNDACCDLSCEDQCGNSECSTDTDCSSGECCIADQSGNICGVCPNCGNRVIDPSEQCDDGKNCIGINGGIVDCTNSTALCADPASCAPQGGDGCSPLCKDEVCGNDVLDPGEECDDGKQCDFNRTVSCQDDAECSALAFCTPGSDGVRRCPDGNRCTVNSDCSDNCIQIDEDSCNNDCEDTQNSCGNGQIDTGETCLTCAADVQCQSGTQCCSDGTCSASCGGGQCGDGQIDSGETCANCAADVQCQSGTQCCSDGTCKASCTATSCNNNNVCDANETCACDDCAGEQDGCQLGQVCDPATDSCTEKICGNTAIEPREHCDTSFPPSDQGPVWQCSASCDLLFTCGNGNVELGEQCELGGQFCLQNCTIDQCGILQSSQGNGFMEQHFNLPSWRYGMDASMIDGPPDPTVDPYLWWSDAYLREVTNIGTSISKPVPYTGPEEDVSGDPAHHSARWFGAVTVPANGFYSYTWGTRDDAWIVIDGVIVDAVRGMQSTVSVLQNSVFLPEGAHTVEIYFVSRQIAPGQEGTFFFAFDDANLTVAPYLPSCSYCGNGLREIGELCDDGFRNGQGNGLCNAQCTGFGQAVCGNNVLETGEECDDGNTAPGDGCSATCRREPVCGNGAREQGEECDDGNTVPGDGCSATCALETICGNGQREGAEKCDDGNTASGDGCSSTCQLELVACGNAVIDAGEQCDSGGLCVGGSGGGTACHSLQEAELCKENGGDCLAQDNDGDMCDRFCQIELPMICGDAIRQGNEECDEGTCPVPAGNAICNDDTRVDRCRTSCMLPSCGDNVTDSGEQCDTGDDRSDILPDRCRLSCELPRCGDDVVDLGEQCDDGVFNHDLLPDRCRSTCTNPRCGDGVTDPQFDEQCDDANTISGDGCSATCTQESAVCGNGQREPGEECDDGNTVSGDGCSAACIAEVPTSCGDGIVQAANGEECDDANTIDTDQCDTNCKYTVCGDGTVQVLNGQGGTEECDDANLIATDACTNTCRTARCGDLIVRDGAEECDDGNADDTDLCTATCTVTKCGDGILQSPNSFGIDEQCDDANTTDNDACTNLCKRASCGDGILFAGIEQCDDGNRTDGDGCSAVCVSEVPSTQPVCGNGIVEPPEQCDDANTIAGDGCSAQCLREGGTSGLCGNGSIDGSEECDDRNTIDNDGCSATCTLESGGGGGGGGPRPTQCGNSFIERGEQCDDGNQTNGDGCSSGCLNETPLTCGNGTVEPPEQCDQGAFNSNTAADACRLSCKNPSCGDGTKDTRQGEQCDDGNTLPGDGCSATCRSEVLTVGCGNGSVELDEECDTGSSNSDSRSDACRTDCRFAVCGDAVLDRGRSEQCDDGNRSNGDGCSNSCQIERASAHPVSDGTDPLQMSPVHPAPQYTPVVTYENPEHAVTASLLSQATTSPGKTPQTGPGTILVITLGGAAFAAYHRKRKQDPCGKWPKSW